MSKTIKKEDLILKKTCEIAPEQYDVFIEDENWEKKEIWYIRLRHWYLSWDYVRNNHYTEVFNHYFDESFKGCFDNEKERKEYLDKIKEKIVEYHNSLVKEKS